MRKSKVVIIFILVILIVLEFLLFTQQKDNKKINESNKNENIYEEVNSEDEKYIADLFTPYMINALEYEEIKDGKLAYHKISGLKNKDLENNINSKIKDKVYELNKKEDDGSKYTIYTEVVGSFENVLSIEFIIKNYMTSSYGYEYYKMTIADTYNCDLNTGNELSITDVILSKSILRTELVNNATEAIYKNIGFVCSGGPCQNPEPDYSKVEDATLAIVNQYNKDNYIFSFSEKGIYLYFNDVMIPNPKEYFEGDEFKVEECKEYESYLEDERRYICQNEYDVGYSTFILFYKMSDNVIIYDKYKKEDSIFTKNSEQVDRKFLKTNTGDDWTMYEVMRESDNQLIDYNLDTSFYVGENTKLFDELLDKVIKESSELKKDKFSVFNINGSIEMSLNDKYYVYFEVTHYNLDKDKYLENKKQIYLDKYDKMTVGNIDTVLSYRTEYDYLKNYLTKKAYYFYIIDKNGKEYSSKDLLNNSFDLSTYIPEEWLTLGKYKTYDDLVNSVIFMQNDLADFPDRLVIYDRGQGIIKLKYKGLEAKIVDGTFFEAEEIRNKMYK